MFKVDITILVTVEDQEDKSLAESVLDALKSQRIATCWGLMDFTFGEIGTNKYLCEYDNDNEHAFTMVACVEVMSSGALMVMIGSDVLHV